MLDIGTGALAVLAIQAAEAGAEHVYAIEVNTTAVEAARRTIEAAGFSSKVTVFHGFSTDPLLVLPAKASLLVHELIGEIAGEEGAVAAIHDARRRFLEPGARPPLSIPTRSRTLIAPCAHPDGEYCAPLPAGLLACKRSWPGTGFASSRPASLLPARSGAGVRDSGLYSRGSAREAAGDLAL